MNILKSTNVMTRGEFIMETLNIWETMKTSTAARSPRHDPEMRSALQELEVAEKVLKNTYLTCELTDLSYLEEQETAANAPE